MATSPRVAVIGSANTDLITFAGVLPRPGETLFGPKWRVVSMAFEVITAFMKLVSWE
jgi:hypothetical protein